MYSKIMENKKQRRCPNLIVTLCIVFSILCTFFAGISIFLWIRLTSVSYEEAPPSNEGSQQQAAQKYPFFPNSNKEEDRMKKMVSGINAANLSWKAKFNAYASLKGSNYTSQGWEKTDSLMLPGQTFEESLDLQAFGDTKEHLTKLARVTITLPESFDARDKWPRCASIHHIPNQGGCGSCWAASAVSVMSDRLCIASNGKEQPMISLQDLVSCCGYCGSCEGGNIPILSYHYWKNHGIPTGGSFGSNEGCRPYEIESTCGTPCPLHFYTADFSPQCNRTCNAIYGKSYDTDLKKGKSFYWIKSSEWYSHMNLSYHEIMKLTSDLSISSNDLIKREIISNGPVSFCTYVAEPFVHYSSGIYDSSQFELEGHENLSYGHCMRMIGWGKENGREFWTVGNSWGREWGENGFGKISFNYRPDDLSVYAGLY